MTRGKVMSGRQLPVVRCPEEVERLKRDKLLDRAVLDDLINSTVQHAFINQWQTLVNSLHNLARSSGSRSWGRLFSSWSCSRAGTSDYSACHRSCHVTIDTKYEKDAVWDASRALVCAEFVARRRFHTAAADIWSFIRSRTQEIWAHNHQYVGNTNVRSFDYSTAESESESEG